MYDFLGTFAMVGQLVPNGPIIYRTERGLNPWRVLFPEVMCKLQYGTGFRVKT